MKTNEILKWTKNLEIDIQEIDNQHQKLVKILNELYAAYSEKKHKDVIRKTIEELVDYTHYHFKTEEDYFKKFNYEGAEAHIKEHEEFINTINEFVLKFSKYDGILTLKVLMFLKDWVKNHIQGTDRKYIECFKSNNL